MQNTLESIPIGIFKNVQFWIANDMQKNLNLSNFGIFWLILFQKSYFFIFFTTTVVKKKVFTQNLKNVRFWLADELK